MGQRNDVDRLGTPMHQVQAADERFELRRRRQKRSNRELADGNDQPGLKQIQLSLQPR